MKPTPELLALIERTPNVTIGGGGVRGIAGRGQSPANQPSIKLPRQSRRVGPNGEFKMELDFERRVIQPKLWAGEIYSYKYEPLSFELCDPAFGKATYKPDFVCVDEAGLLVYEIKGFRREAAILRLKVFADRHRHIRVHICIKRNRKWHIERIGRDSIADVA